VPLYEYKCPTCGYEKEFLFEIDHHAPLCPTCCWNPYINGEKEIMVKLVSIPGRPKFKGPGFYETDYKNSKDN